MFRNNAVPERGAPLLKEQKPIKVCIRGMFGVLGQRLAMAVKKQPDMKLEVGIVKNDETLDDTLKKLKSLSDSREIRKILPEKMYLDESKEVVDQVNDSQDLIKFEVANNHNNLSNECDVIVDSSIDTGKDGENWKKRYNEFKGKIILQSGRYPQGRLIVPPLMDKQSTEEKTYRMGDCVLCGTIPVLTLLAPLTKYMELDISMQYDKKGQYTTDQRLATTYYRADTVEELQPQFDLLLKRFQMEMELTDVLQNPGRSHYTGNLRVYPCTSLTGEDIKEYLSNQTRIRVFPELGNTHQLADEKEFAQKFGHELKPIVVSGKDLNSKERKKRFFIRITMDYKCIVALPNIDAIRMLVLGLNSKDAMMLTDKNMGLI